MKNKIKQQIEEAEKISEQFIGDKSPQFKPVEKWTTEEHNEWKKWNKKRDDLNKNFKKKYGKHPNLELLKAQLKGYEQGKKDILNKIGEIDISNIIRTNKNASECEHKIKQELIKSIEEVK